MTNLRLVALAFAITLLLTAALRAADQITVTFPDSPRFPVFAHDQPVKTVLWAHRENPTSADQLHWSLHDYTGQKLREGTIPVLAGETTLHHELTLNGLPSGYLEIRARLAASGVTLPRAGSRPPGIATFGVLSPLAALPLAQPADSRFGIQGTNFIKTGIFMQGDPYDPLYPALGIHWVNVGQSWAGAEPERPGQYAPANTKTFTGESSYMERNNLEPLFCVFDLPWWAIDFPADFRVDRSQGHQRQWFPPKDPALYAAYLTKMAAHQVTLRGSQPGAPASFRNHYQIGWEPDWHWKGTDEQFVSLYKTVSDAIRSADPRAVILGPGDGVLKQAIARLQRILPLGFAQNLDGLAVHGYYTPFGNPTAIEPGDKLISPEDGGVIESLRALRGMMRQYFKPDAKLFQTEWGLDYRGAYLDLNPELLKLHAAYITRGHLLFLGEGCDMTYFFYTADYGNLKQRGEDGYGLCFNLTLPDPSFGAIKVSPKPVFMSAAALTRVLEGTKTLGPVDLGDPAICAYAFRRGPDTVLAIWTRDNSVRNVRITTNTAETTLTHIDFMGNSTRQTSAPDGTLTLTADAYPRYLIGNLPPRLAGN